MSTLRFEVPPFPTYITGGKEVFQKGKKHMKRTFSVFDLLIVEEGQIYISENDHNYEIKDGEYIILAPGLEHYSYKPCMCDTTYYWLHFDLEVPYELKSVSDINWAMIIKQERTYTEAAKHMLHIPRVGTLMNPEFLYRELDRLLSLNTTNTPDQRLKEQLVFQEFILHLQADCVTVPTSAEQVTKRTIIYIQENYQNESIKMTQISKQLLFHPDYITRCMQKTLGVTPMQYLTTYRLSIAKQLLATTNEKLNAIAKQVGIHDSTYFSRIFKKAEGVTPMQFRRLVKRERL